MFLSNFDNKASHVADWSKTTVLLPQVRGNLCIFIIEMCRAINNDGTFSTAGKICQQQGINDKTGRLVFSFLVYGIDIEIPSVVLTEAVRSGFRNENLRTNPHNLHQLILTKGYSGNKAMRHSKT